MLKAEFHDANGQSFEGAQLGLDGVMDAVTSAFSSVKSAVGTVASAACKAIPIASTVAQQKAGSEYQSTISKASSTAQNLCERYGSKPRAAAAPKPKKPKVKTMKVAPIVVTPQRKYPQGSVARYNVTRRMWSIYAPTGSTVSGLGIFGLVYGLGQDLPPPGTTKAGDEPEPRDPVTGETIPQTPDKEGVPIYQKPLFWVAVIGGVAVVGTGGYFLLRPKAKAA